MGKARTKTGDPDFGRSIRKLRKARGLTQEELAEHADLSSDTIRRLELAGFSPSLDTLRKLATGLRMDLVTTNCNWDR